MIERNGGDSFLLGGMLTWLRLFAGKRSAVDWRYGIKINGGADLLSKSMEGVMFERESLPCPPLFVYFEEPPQAGSILRVLLTDLQRRRK